MGKSAYIKILYRDGGMIIDLWKQARMKKEAIGKQDFRKIIEGNYFYVNKTDFIKEWWENGDDVTLITQPR